MPYSRIEITMFFLSVHHFKAFFYRPQKSDAAVTPRVRWVDSRCSNRPIGRGQIMRASDRFPDSSREPAYASYFVDRKNATALKALYRSDWGIRGIPSAVLFHRSCVPSDTNVTITDGGGGGRPSPPPLYRLWLIAYRETGSNGLSCWHAPDRTIFFQFYSA